MKFIFDSGQFVFDCAYSCGHGLLLMLRAASHWPYALIKPGKVIGQMHLTGVQSLPLTLLVAAFTGMVLCLQTGIEMMRWGQEDLIGNIVSPAMCREMGPVFVALILAGRVGAAMAAELGTMNVSEEIDALEVMNIDPARFLVLPRIVALTLMCPILVIFANLTGIYAGGIVAQYQLQVNYDTYFTNAREVLELVDIYSGLFKALVFGLIISVVGCSQGLRATNGAEGVGRATRATVVNSFILIIVTNYIITSFVKVFWQS